MPSVRWHVQCDVQCDDAQPLVRDVPRTCVEAVVPATTLQRIARALKPAVRTLVLLHDGCGAADREADELHRAHAEGTLTLATTVEAVTSLHELNLTVARYQNDTGALLLLPSYQCLDHANASAVRPPSLHLDPPSRSCRLLEGEMGFRVGV